MIAVLAVVMLVSNLRGRMVAGTPTVTAGVPLLGSCVAALDDIWQHQLIPGTGMTGTEHYESATYAFPSAAFAACDRQKVGEVVTVNYAANPPAAGLMTQLTAPPSCLQNWEDRAGYGQITDHRRGNVITWQPALSITAQLAGPTPEQRAAGQQWVACVLTAVGPNVQQTAPMPYPGSLSDTPLPNIFGICADPRTSPYIANPIVSCAAPHSQQILAAVVSLGGTPTNPDLQASCLQIAASLTQKPDPTSAGALTINYLRDPTGSSTSFGPYGSCVATAPEGRRLDGSLIEIGNQQLPWAS